MVPVNEPEGEEGGTDLVYVARRIREAKRVERVLEQHAIEYSVDMVPFRGHVLGILPVEYRGAGFYVLPEAAELSGRLLAEAGLKRGISGGGER